MRVPHYDSHSERCLGSRIFNNYFLLRRNILSAMISQIVYKNKPQTTRTFIIVKGNPMPEKPAFNWAENMQQYQKAYADACHAFLDGTNQPGTPEQNQTDDKAKVNPWLDAMNNWWQSASDESSEPTHDFYGKLVEQGRAFLEMTDNFSTALHSAQDSSHATTAHLEALIEHATQNFKNVFSNSAWQMPLSNWQHVTSAMSFLPGDAFQGMEIPLNFNQSDLQGNIDKILSAPRVGQNRVKQEQQQKLLKLLLNYQSTLQEYSDAQSEIGSLSVRKFQERLTEIASSDDTKPLSSFKEVFDCWVDCCESVYAEYVMTDEYSATHGKMVNALMEVKQHGRRMVDETLGALNMPTRQELDTLHYRFHEIRRKDKVQSKGLDEVKKELLTIINNQAEQIKTLQKQAISPKTRTTASRSAAKPTEKKTTASKASPASKRTTRKSPSAKATAKIKEA